MTLKDRILAWRDRRLTSARFQQRMSAIPFVRGLAKQKAREAFNLCAGFVYSQVLQACIQLQLLEMVRDAPRTLAELSQETGLEAAGLERLVRAAVSLGLLHTRSGNRIGLGETGAALLGNPGVLSMIRHHQLLYQDLADPVGLLKARTAHTQLAQYWAYAGRNTPDESASVEVSDYSQLMADTQAFIAAEILHAVSLRDVSHLMDVGGGLGAFLAKAGHAYPRIDLTLFDLPAVVDQAREHLGAELPDRDVRRVGGNMFSDPLPTGADAISLVRILHDHDDEPVRALLASVRKTLKPGGQLIIAEPMAGTPGAEEMGDAYFGFYLWAMGSGRPRTRQELTQMLHEAGFASVTERKSRQPLLTRILTAR